MSTCLDPETLAAFAEGFLSRDEAKAVLAHVEECDDCMTTLEALNETIATRPQGGVRTSRPHTWWLAAAAAVLIVFVVARHQRSPISRLIALAPARPVEARLSADFPWSAYHGPMRAEESETDPQRMRLIGTAGDIVANADRDHSAKAQQNAGIALMVVDKPQAAIDRLRAATTASPNDVAAWSDLAAAQDSAAMRLSRPSLLPEALVSADHALRLDPHHAPSLFNRALILEHLGLTNEARQAWQRYLDVDPSSAWAVEARSRLAKLTQEGSGRLVRSVRTGTSAPLFASNAQKARTFAEAETLARWAEAFQRGDEASAQRELNSARETGDMLVKSSGESLLHDAVRAIDDASNRATLAEAHLAYRRGRIAYARQQLDAALPDLDRAAQLFAQGHSPMSLVARYYAASVRFDRHDVAAARDELQTLLGEIAAHPQFIALGAETRWELALSLMVAGDWSGALPLLQQARDAFARLDERNHLGSIDSMLADALLSLGRMDEAWAARIRAFTQLEADGSGDRLPVSMTGAVQMEMRSGRLRTARALLDLERASLGAIGNGGIAADVLVHCALVNAQLGDREEASQSLRDAAIATSHIADPATRAMAETHLELAGAAIALKSDPPRAREMLTRAIDAYRASGRIVYLPECFLLRARTDDASAAAADLDRGIETLEQSRVRTGAVVGTGVLNAGVALFEDAIRLCADRGDVAGAFAYAERSRAQLEGAPPIGLHELQQRLANSDTAVLELAQLPETLIVICATSDRAELAREETPSTAPFASLLAGTKHLIVVADRSLRSTPFAALDDGGHFLVERMTVSMAMSASALMPVPGGANGSLLAVALPAGGATAGLPESTREIADVRPMYRSAVTITPDAATFAAFAQAAPNADVIHIAGHTAQQSNDAGTALLFAHDRVTWSAIASKHLPRSPIVVLAACETLRPHATLTLGDGFLAAGARAVIGTLAPIADEDAHELFESIHRRLAAGATPAEAVRDAQLEAIARHSTAWRAVTSLTRCIHTNVKRS